MSELITLVKSEFQALEEGAKNLVDKAKAVLASLTEIGNPAAGHEALAGAAASLDSHIKNPNTLLPVVSMTSAPVAPAAPPEPPKTPVGPTPPAPPATPPSHITPPAPITEPPPPFPAPTHVAPAVTASPVPTPDPAVAPVA